MAVSLTRGILQARPHLLDVERSPMIHCSLVAETLH